MRQSKLTYLLLIIGLITFFFSTSLFAQTDIGPETKLNVTGKYGITPEEEADLLNNKVIEKEIPQELLEQLHNARMNDNIEEAEAIQREIDKYSVGTYKVSINESRGPLPVPDYSFYDPPKKPMWLDSNILIYAGQQSNPQNRSLDLKMGEDGNLYLAHTDNYSATKRLWVYKSTDLGATWSNILTASYGTNYFQTISMLVERRHGSNNDSTRVIIYYTASSSSNNDGAWGGFISFRPNTVNEDFRTGNILYPTSGRELNWVSAISDGHYWQLADYHGVVFGEYSNNGDTCVSMRFLRTTDWCKSHTGVTLATTWKDFYPTAAYKPESSADSVYIAVERRFSDQTHIRVYKTRWSPTSAYDVVYLTTTGAGIHYAKPVISVKHDKKSLPKEIIITCTKDGEARYHYSHNGGRVWATDATLDLQHKNTSTYTWVTTDSTTAGNDWALAIFGNSDSLNIRRGRVGSMGGATYKQNTFDVTGTAEPVCGIINDAGTKYSSFAYWGWGPENVYFDAENIGTSINELPGKVEEFSLAQNYPNPFNPTTNIEYSIAEAGLVELKIYNILGEEMTTLVNQFQNASKYRIDFNAANLSSGIYFYRITSGKFTDVKKMILIK